MGLPADFAAVEAGLFAAVGEALGIEDAGSVLRLSLPPEGITADFALACFPLARVCRRSPQQLAATVAEHLDGHPWVRAARAAGPYVNLELEPAVLFGVPVGQALAEDRAFGRSQRAAGKRILVEYSSPNTNKPLHLGHVRNNALGMAVANLFEAIGAEVVRAVIFNDRGIHIAKTMVAYRRFQEGNTPEKAGMKGDHFLGMLYVLFAREEPHDPTLMEEAREMLRRWEAGDPEVRALWQQLNDWALEGIWQTYERTGCRFDLIQRESETYLLGQKIAREGLARGVFQQKEDGSVWADLRAYGLDEKVVLRADGTSVYVTQDLGTAVERFEKYHLDRAYYVVASEQNYHFRVLFKMLELLGYPFADRCVHLSYGMVYLPEGKMKSREGTVVDADELFDGMAAMAREVMASSSQSFSAEELDRIAEVVGQGAVKYYILKVNPKKDIHFNPEESLSFEGATGAYLQYTHARICSMERKGAERSFPEPQPELLGNPEERAVAVQLARFPSVVAEAAETTNPAHLASYLWQLARSYNSFYYKHPVLAGDPPALAAARLQLSTAVRITLRNGLALLGIEAPEKM
jgi:arginyl-tRNA synthetase